MKIYVHLFFLCWKLFGGVESNWVNVSKSCKENTWSYYNTIFRTTVQRITVLETYDDFLQDFKTLIWKELVEPFQNKPLFPCWVFCSDFSNNSRNEGGSLLKLDLITFLMRYIHVRSLLSVEKPVVFSNESSRNAVGVVSSFLAKIFIVEETVFLQEFFFTS